MPKVTQIVTFVLENDCCGNPVNGTIEYDALYEPIEAKGGDGDGAIQLCPEDSAIKNPHSEN